MDDTSTGTGDTWGAYVQRAADRVGGVAELARRVSMHRGTLHDYISGRAKKKVTIETVVAIARGSGDHPVNAFIAAAGLIEEEPQDREVGMILASDLPDEEKQRQIAVITRKREQDEQRRIMDTQELIRFHGERRAS